MARVKIKQFGQETFVVTVNNEPIGPAVSFARATIIVAWLRFALPELEGYLKNE